VGWTLFPEDAKQKLRLKRFFMAALSYVLWVGLTFYCYQLGLVDVSYEQFWVAAALAFLCNLVFYLLIRSGLNLYWPDPSLTLPQMILFESFLSFLGLGVQEPMASLGSLINDGAQEIQSAPWMLLVPAGFLVVLLVCFNLVGDALRDALDPRDG